MSSVSSVGQGLFQYLQGLSGTSSSTSVSSPQVVGGTDTDGDNDGSTGSAVQGAGHHGHGHGGKGALFQKVASAVTDALQAAQSDGNSDGTDQIIQNAISQVLGGTNGSTTDPSTTAPAADPTASGAASAQADGNSGSPAASFFQTLQGFGVTPEQFRKDFLAAVQGSKGTQANPQALAQAFPPGSAIDVTA